MRNIIVFLITLFLVLSPLLVFAVGGVNPGDPGFVGPPAPTSGIVPCTDTCRICHLFVGAKNIVDFIVLKLVTPLAVIMLIYGAIMMLISGGDPKKITTAKGAITSAIWGLVVAYGSWLLVDTLLKAIAAGMGPGGTGTVGEIKGWGMWNEIPNCN